MSSRTIKTTRSLAFRLTLAYAGIFTLSSCIAFFLFYFLMTSVLRSQIDQELLKQSGVFASLLRTGGIDAVKSVAVLESKASGEKKIFFRLLSTTGQAFSSSNMSYWEDIGISKESIGRLLAGASHVYDTIDIAERNHSVRILYTVIGPRILLQLGQSMENISRFVQAFQKIFIATMAVLSIFAGAVGWFMARRAVSGVESVTRTAQRISEGSLAQRVPVRSHGDEIDQLAVTFNQMLDRIEILVTGIKEMSDNIAHDLKSPITRIRGIAEITLTTGTAVDEYQGMAASIVEECDRLLDMINTMLMISKTDAGIITLETEPVDLAAIVRNACELFHPMAEDKQIRLACRTPESVPMIGDNHLIQRMIGNLVDNAVKYTPACGKIAIDVVEKAGPAAEIRIRDTGCGISKEDIGNIFKRFYRCDQSRSEKGFGLGLSLAQAVARAHGGDIEADSQPGQGSTFTITLPLRRSAGEDFRSIKQSIGLAQPV
ncbi:MAG: HAMP domain-containing protein [Desulfobacteraceae bacterium]|nr:MAG: HAMP domain-containing protein [Desulfobacteraceae bacterium]